MIFFNLFQKCVTFLETSQRFFFLPSRSKTINIYRTVFLENFFWHLCKLTQENKKKKQCSLFVINVSVQQWKMIFFFTIYKKFTSFFSNMVRKINFRCWTDTLITNGNRDKNHILLLDRHINYNQNFFVQKKLKKHFSVTFTPKTFLEWKCEELFWKKKHFVLLLQNFFSKFVQKQVL